MYVGKMWAGVFVYVCVRVCVCSYMYVFMVDGSNKQHKQIMISRKLEAHDGDFKRNLYTHTYSYTHMHTHQNTYTPILKYINTHVHTYTDTIYVFFLTQALWLCVHGSASLNKS